MIMHILESLQVILKQASQQWGTSIVLLLITFNI